MSSLALFGGEPVRRDTLPYARQTITEADIEAVVRVLRSDRLTTGPRVEEFEDAFAARVGARFAVAYSSGTAALHGAAFAAGLGEGDEAITTPLTFCATANSVVYQGARPVFADVSDDTLNLDPAQVVRALTNRTRAVIAVDYAGHPADLEALHNLCSDRDLLLIDDACHALGATLGGRHLGQIADLTVFSFHPVKHIATGEGGMVTTADAALAQRLRMFRNHGLDADVREREAGGHWSYDMVALGWNYRLTDIASALGISQLRGLDSSLRRRREIAAVYDDAFSRLAGLRPPHVRPGVAPAWHLYAIRLEAQDPPRDRVIEALRAEGIGANVHYRPVHLLAYYTVRFGHRPGELPIAEDATTRLVSLPMFPAMTDDDVDDVVRAVGKVLSHFGCGR